MNQIKLDIIRKIKKDLTDIIDQTNLEFMPDYYKYDNE